MAVRGRACARDLGDQVLDQLVHEGVASGPRPPTRRWRSAQIASCSTKATICHKACVSCRMCSSVWNATIQEIRPAHKAACLVVSSYVSAHRHEVAAALDMLS